MDWKRNSTNMVTSVLWAWLKSITRQAQTMANTASFSAIRLDEVAGMDEFLVDSPRVKELLTNLEKLRSSEASHLECFFSMLRSKVSCMIKAAAVYGLLMLLHTMYSWKR